MPELIDLSHTFLPGHRIMVQIQSTWFPLYDRNPQKYVRLIARTEVMRSLARNAPLAS